MGFVEHGLTLVLQQREAIRDAVIHCAALSGLVAQLEQLGAAPPPPPTGQASAADASAADESTEPLAPQRALAAELRSVSHGVDRISLLAVET